MSELEPAEANLRTYLQVLIRRSHWVIAVTILSVAVAVVIGSIQRKEYSASAQLLVTPTVTIPISSTPQTISPADILTKLQLLTSAPVKAGAASRLGMKPLITGSQIGQTNVISVIAMAETPSLAARTANTYAEVFVAYQRTNAINSLTRAEKEYQAQINAINTQIQVLQRSTSPTTASTVSALTTQEAALSSDWEQLRVAEVETPGGVDLVSLASPPSSPSSPRIFRDGTIALVIGLLLGLAVAFLVDYFDDNVYTKDEAEWFTGGVPVLALIPKITSWKKSRRAKPIAREEPLSPITESYRSLGAWLQFARHDAPLKTILVTSAAGTEGKTSTVANLAIVLANAGERVVVVGCDLRRPHIGTFLDQSDDPGFTSVLLGEKDLKSAVQHVTKTPGMAFLGTGPIPPNPAEMLGSAKAAEVFGVLSADYDVVLIDSPPLLVADALVLASYADAVLLVVAAGETKKGQVERATELLGQVNARPVGIVLSGVVRRSKRGPDYTYGRQYRYSSQRSHVSGISQKGHAEPPAPTHRRKRRAVA